MGDQRTEDGGQRTDDRRKPTGFRFGAIILAAGASTRMGAPKQLLEIEGRPLVVRAVEAALGSAAWPVVVVLGANAAQIRPRLTRLPVLIADNPTWAEGMASSIRAGIAMLRQFSRALDGAVIALCDQAAFSPQTIAQLTAAQRASGRSIIAARYAGKNGAPALFLREHFAALAALTGDEGARILLNGPAGQVATVDLPELAFDLDTPEDYERWRGGTR
ncbi:MAG TPA: nucleotidyltransferase family protein [Opitutaceae bacterium]|nr:nucleotidyltransferase family protein [Opitutaceae bacterium]